jgi:hypothetical protein
MNEKVIINDWRAWSQHRLLASITEMSLSMVIFGAYINYTALRSVISVMTF